MADALLTVKGLSKRFGGLTATDNIDLSISNGELRALIGPNGAGKSTLIALLSGELKPDAGAIIVGSEDVTHLPSYMRAAHGMARSFQTTSVFLELTALENVALGVQSRSGHSFRFWKPVHADEALLAPAFAILDQAGLRDCAHRLAGHLSHGERRALEIAMALATGPRLLLLDEPMAGMGSNDATFMLKLLQGLKGKLTILLIEHDMDTVFALADQITVLVYGRVLATGKPEVIRADQGVRDAYLGQVAVRHD